MVSTLTTPPLFRKQRVTQAPRPSGPPLHSDGLGSSATKEEQSLQGRLRVAEEELLQQRAFVAGLEGELAAAEARAAAAEARLLEVRRFAPIFLHTFMYV